MKIGRKIGEGGNSEVFEWGNNKVIKLAKPNTDITALQREYKNNLTCGEWVYLFQSHLKLWSSIIALELYLTVLMENP